MKKFTVPIVFCNYTVQPVQKLNQAAGSCDLKKRLIKIAPGTSNENWRATLWHEIFHALMHELGRTELCDDEAFVESLAISIMRIRKDLPDL